MCKFDFYVEAVAFCEVNFKFKFHSGKHSKIMLIFILFLKDFKSRIFKIQIFTIVCLLTLFELHITLFYKVVE